jgi:DNA-binding IclR family transcriptional regulator
MARPAPGVERTVSVLGFLAAHPGESFSLSELARRLDLNKATCHALLTTLTDAAYLLRHPTQLTYTLGPALIAIGQAAEGQFEAVDFARVEMRALSDELGLECLATAAVADEMVIVARTGNPRVLGTSPPTGQRLPIAPPLGTVFMAWASTAEIDAWLQRGTGDEIPRYHLALLAVRQRGYAVGLEADPRAALGRALAQLAGVARPARVRGVVEQLIDELGHDEYILTELDQAATYMVNHLVAPVFGADGGVVLALSLFGFGRSLSGEDVEDYGQRLLQATAAVTKSIHGREPA